MAKAVDYLKKDLRGLANKERALVCERFFKTGKGEYAEGDRFLGIAVPDLRRLLMQYWKMLDYEGIRELLFSAYNEERRLGLMVLGKQFGKIVAPEEAYEFYVAHRDRVNNWNLVDVSARPIVGVYLLDKDRSVLKTWADSESLWVRRIAIVASWAFIKCGEFEDTLDLATQLMGDKEDLIHKAVGWMLRELGKQDEGVLKDFLKMHCRAMPRTMLRYAIERLKEEERVRFLRT